MKVACFPSGRVTNNPLDEALDVRFEELGGGRAHVHDAQVTVS